MTILQTRGAVAITGIGTSEFGKGLPRSAWQLALDASLEAIADAGLDPADIDGVARFTSPLEQVTVPAMARGLGVRELSFFTEGPLGGKAIGAVLAHSVNAIAAGQARNVLVFRSLSQSTFGRFGRADRGGASGDTVVPEESNQSYAWPYGMFAPAHFFAMMAARYAHEHGLTHDELSLALGTIAVTQRAYANRNPAAIMRDRPMTLEDYFGSKPIASPLRMFDLCLENDGAVAFVLTRADAPSTSAAPPVRILAVTQSLVPYHEPFGIYMPDITRSFPWPEVSKRLYDAAGLPPSRIRVAELYDANSYMTLRSLESYGLIPEGSGARYLVETGIGPDSPLPVNTHGGHLSEAYIHGMNGLTEAVRQLRGTSANQIPSADVALVATPAGSATVLGV